MFQDIFNVLASLIYDLTNSTVDLISGAVINYGKDLIEYNINIVLFSDTPILATNLEDLTALFFAFFYSVFFIVLLYKVTKKVIKSIFGVLKWW